MKDCSRCYLLFLCLTIRAYFAELLAGGIDKI